MIKIWKGIEHEAVRLQDTEMTIFVCSDCTLPSGLIIRMLEEQVDANRVYFGAGRRQFYGMSEDDWAAFMNYCELHETKVVIEICPDDEKFAHDLVRPLSENQTDLITFIFASYSFPDLRKAGLYFKTDDYSITRIFGPLRSVDISSVKDNRYADDVVIYEEV